MITLKKYQPVFHMGFTRLRKVNAQPGKAPFCGLANASTIDRGERQ